MSVDVDIRALIRFAVGEAEKDRTAPRKWTAKEEAFVCANLGRMTDEEMGQALDRSAVAVHLRWDREMGLPGPSKSPQLITAHQAAALLGIDGHKIVHWVDMGLIPGWIMAGGRNIRLIDRQAFRRWVLNPMNWVYFNPKKVRDPELKRMCRKRAKRWGDEWWTTRQVADYHGISLQAVDQQIRRGALKSFHLPVSLGGRHPNLRWSNHFILKSVALRAVFLQGKGNHKSLKFTPAADRWLLKARDELDMAFVHIGRTMKLGKVRDNSNSTIAWRYYWLKAQQTNQRKTRKQKSR